MNTNAPLDRVVYRVIGHNEIVNSIKTNVKLNSIFSFVLKKNLINLNIVIRNSHSTTKQNLLVNIY